MVIVNHEEGTINNALKETVIIKNEEEPKTKFDIPPLANAANEEALPGKFSDKVEYLSECLPKDPNDEIINMNENKKEIHAPNTEKSPLIGTSQEKTHTKESETTNHEEGYDSELEKHKSDQSSIQRGDIEHEKELNKVSLLQRRMSNIAEYKSSTVHIKGFQVIIFTGSSNIP